MTPSKRPFRHQREPRIDIARVGESGSILALAAASFSVPADLNAAASAAERAGYRLIVASDARALVSGRTETGEEMNFVVDSALDEASAEGCGGSWCCRAGGAPSTRSTIPPPPPPTPALRLIQDVFASGAGPSSPPARR